MPFLPMEVEGVEYKKVLNSGPYVSYGFKVTSFGTFRALDAAIKSIGDNE